MKTRLLLVVQPLHQLMVAVLAKEVAAQVQEERIHLLDLQKQRLRFTQRKNRKNVRQRGRRQRRRERQVCLASLVLLDLDLVDLVDQEQGLVFHDLLCHSHLELLLVKTKMRVRGRKGSVVRLNIFGLGAFIA
jgi:hypothetical protein